MKTINYLTFHAREMIKIHIQERDNRNKIRNDINFKVFYSERNETRLQERIMHNNNESLLGRDNNNNNIFWDLIHHSRTLIIPGLSRHQDSIDWKMIK